MSHEHEINELEKNIDELSSMLAAIAGDPDAIAKAEADAVDEGELAEIEASVDAIATDLGQELNKRTTESWNSCVRKIAELENVPVTVAMSKARQHFPDLFEHLQKNAPAPHNRISGFAPLGPEGAQRARDQFQSLCREIAANSNGRIAGIAAMSKARTTAPELYKAAFGE